MKDYDRYLLTKLEALLSWHFRQITCRCMSNLPIDIRACDRHAKARRMLKNTNTYRHLYPHVTNYVYLYSFI